uniref:Plastid lipid-associated protein/fibrillin conserved domain-containing protein n=1 Tax=Leersia perrieri TaxID=77586 RepID=A0A0D9XB45_9ORYZ
MASSSLTTLSLSTASPPVRRVAPPALRAFAGTPRFPSLRAAPARRKLTARAVAGDVEDEWGKEPADDGSSATAVADGVPVSSEVAELKAKLKEALYGTERGLRASSETRAEVVELITQLEARNPTPAPTHALTLLNGKWILAYTSFSQLFPLLGSGSLPQLVKVEEISQTIDSENFTVQNCIKFSGPLATTSVSTNAKFEIRSPKRVQIKFDEGIIASSVARTISGQPPLKIPIRTDNAESWLLTTYLDDELRISRGDGSSIFVLFKEGSTLLY